MRSNERKNGQSLNTVGEYHPKAKKIIENVENYKTIIRYDISPMQKE